MTVPGLIYMICNNYLPMFGIVIAFKKLNFAKGIFASPWCGLENFEFLFRSSTAFTIIRNTVLYNVVFIILGNVIAIAVAVLLNEIRSRRASKVYQSVILLPYLMSWVVASYLFYALLASDTGMINNFILEPLGLEPVNWYSEKQYWPVILTVVYIWKNVGYQMIIYLSSIVSISPEYYEAATIDGATKWQQIRKITLPLLKPTVITLLILAVGRIFASDFGLFYQVPRNSGALYETTQTIDVYVYNALMRQSDYGMSSAASVFQSVVGFVLVMVTNFIARKTNKESALF
ncbi:MAG TPA: sugar ABC transporter permease [Candidatus Scybalocola faecigallinarum]|uniref:Sugar ABC transporter permease n=1 Tax=Candidatus Scybalocola faecigallinarum TaxID=2840941 RepID=A0A9D1F3I3_9FIRM|nr:sugar ABC transporter permease [Candidatus Scybalocola faecigallinarum]